MDKERKILTRGNKYEIDSAFSDARKLMQITERTENYLRGYHKIPDRSAIEKNVRKIKKLFLIAKTRGLILQDPLPSCLKNQADNKD